MPLDPCIVCAGYGICNKIWRRNKETKELTRLLGASEGTTRTMIARRAVMATATWWTGSVARAGSLPGIILCGVHAAFTGLCRIIGRFGRRGRFFLRLTLFWLLRWRRRRRFQGVALLKIVQDLNRSAKTFACMRLQFSFVRLATDWCQFLANWMEIFARR